MWAIDPQEPGTTSGTDEEQQLVNCCSELSDRLHEPPLTATQTKLRLRAWIATDDPLERCTAQVRCWSSLALERGR